MVRGESKLPLFEIGFIIAGELVVSLLIVAVFLILKAFEWSVVFGALLGSSVVVLNFVWLSVSVNRAVDKALAERPDGELDDEAVEKFSLEHTASVQNAAKLSYIIRTVSTLLVLVLAFLLGDVFNVIATLIPLLMLQPILWACEIIKRRYGKQ